MKNIISDNLNGILDLQGKGEGYDSSFNVQDSLVTIIPLNGSAKRHSHVLSYNDGSNEKDDWLFGLAEDNCKIAFLKKTHLAQRFSSSIDLSASKFFAPIIVKASKPKDIDLKTFDAIEFRCGIVDILHLSALAINEEYSQRRITFKEKETFTYRYEVTVNKEKFEIVYSVDIGEVVMEAGKIPDLRSEIHSFVRFNFTEEKSLNDIEKYYSYAIHLFQFCAGRLNVGFEIRLYKNEFCGDKRIINPAPIFVKFQDGFDDYANDNIKFTDLIRFQLLGDRLPNVFELLNDKKKQPHLLFLPKKNKQVYKILYTDITDMCVAFEKEYSFLNKTKDEINQNAAKNLTEKLLYLVEQEIECPECVKLKATNILNSQLKNFSPSLKEKFFMLYEEFGTSAKVTEIYEAKEFKKIVSDFVDIRHKASHAGIVWNKSTEVFPYLKKLIYFSVLKRSGYKLNESVAILSWMFKY